MFVLNSDITIGNFRFSGVHDVRIRRSIHSYADRATIKIPSIARVYRKNGSADAGLITVGNLIKEGDKVKIVLGYGERMHTEFEGFVLRRNLAMPLEIECEGYVRQLRLNENISGYLKETSAKQLLEIAAGIADGKGKRYATPKSDIRIDCQVDIPMHKIKMINASGAQIIDEIVKVSQGTLSVFFIEPKVLWCGFTYTPYVEQRDPFGNGAVSYRLGYNCLKDNGLKERVVSEPVQVILQGRFATGQLVQTASEAVHVLKVEKRIVNNIQSEDYLKRMANEKQYRMNYNGYEGNITGFLEPFCQPGYVATITDKRYPERDGKYMVEGTEVTFGVEGARRIVEIGPLLGFNPNKVNR